MLESKICLQKYLQKPFQQLFNYVQPQQKEKDYNMELRFLDKFSR